MDVNTGELWEMDGENREHQVSMASLLIRANVGASVFAHWSSSWHTQPTLSNTVSLSRT